jgi:hypothetical protein
LNVGIIGCRARDTDADFQLVLEAFKEIQDWNSMDVLATYTIVSGGCKEGGDRFAEIIADRFGLPKIIHYPDLKEPRRGRDNRRWYRDICFARNTLIARDSQYLIACIRPDRQGGTEDTIRKFLHLYHKRPDCLKLV